MRKIFLSLAVICCIVTTASAAVGDKIYFIDNSGLEGATFYGVEYDSNWTTLWEEGWTVNFVSTENDLHGFPIYEYTIQSADCVKFGIKYYTDAEGWFTESFDPSDGLYLHLSTGTTYLAEGNSYAEFYFVNNTGFAGAEAMNIVLSESTNWADLEGKGWAGSAMTKIGQTGGYDVWKYSAVISAECNYIQVIDPSDATNKIWGLPTSGVATQNVLYSWGENNYWHTINEVFNPITLTYSTNAAGDTWESNDQMWWDADMGKYTLSRNNVHITETGWYNFSVLINGSYDARYPHTNAANWHEFIELNPGMYSLYYTYDPATDELTCMPSADYSREVGAADKWGTMCLPNASTSYSGATFYTIAKKEGDAIVLQEVEGQLKAGYPYFFKSSSEWVSVILDASDYANTPDNSNGLYGSYREYALTEHSIYDYYMLSENELWEVEGNEAKVGAYRCFVNMTEVPADANLAPGKRYVHMTVNGENGTTAIEDIQSDKAQSIKVIENGQLFIIKNGEKYNAQGIIVK